MDDLVSRSLSAASNAQVGDHNGYDKTSLKAYVSESKLKRVITINTKEVVAYLLDKFKISNPIKVRLDDSKDKKGAHEDFDVIELIKFKLISFNAKTCLRLWDIYEEKGLHSLINAIQYLSPIQKI